MSDLLPNQLNRFSEWAIIKSIGIFIEFLARFFALPVECFLHTKFGERYFTPFCLLGSLSWLLWGTLFAGTQVQFQGVNVPAANPKVQIFPGQAAPAQGAVAAAGQPERERIWLPNIPLLCFTLFFLGFAVYHWFYILRRIWKRWPHIHSRSTGQPHGFLMVLTWPLEQWFTIEERAVVLKRFVEPILIGGLAYAIIYVNRYFPERTRAFLGSYLLGYYLAICAVWMFIRANLEYYRLRARLLDMLDQGIEMEVMNAAVEGRSPEASAEGFVLPGASKVSRADRKRLASVRANSVDEAIKELDGTLRDLITGKPPGEEERVKADENGEQQAVEGDAAPSEPPVKQGSSQELPPGAAGLDPEMRKLLFGNLDGSAVDEEAEPVAEDTSPESQGEPGTPEWLASMQAAAERDAKRTGSETPKRVRCPGCNKLYQVPGARKGKSICKKCGRPFRWES